MGEGVKYKEGNYKEIGEHRSDLWDGEDFKIKQELEKITKVKSIILITLN